MPPEGWCALCRGVLKIGMVDDPSVYGGTQMAIFTGEGQPFHHIARGVAAFEGSPPRR